VALGVGYSRVELPDIDAYRQADCEYSERPCDGSTNGLVVTIILRTDHHTVEYLHCSQCRSQTQVSGEERRTEVLYDTNRQITKRRFQHDCYTT
jgi:hypothetical protein